ncbi:MAG: BolA family transcriptional regulator [bacterium]|nr:BolA family transcriptional regulator [bacterium]
MPLEILGDDSAQVIERIRVAIESAIDCHELSIDAGAPGHFSIRAVSDVFLGQSRVKQQQLIYRAIADLLQGDEAPVHAIDRLECLKPPPKPSE